MTYNVLSGMLSQHHYYYCGINEMPCRIHRIFPRKTLILTYDGTVNDDDEKHLQNEVNSMM